jgi:acetyltransferase-like isoleucine patch superfamily enzyme
VIRDHRPYFIKKFFVDVENFYVRRFLSPHFTRLGPNYTFVRPWTVRIFGAPIVVGAFSNVISAPDNNVKFTVWSENKPVKGITIGDYCLICPGVRITSAVEITIGDNCMFANGVFITDSDWHGIYNRVSTGKRKPVIIADNVWVGDSATICKGVTIGENSIVGAGAVVAGDVPENCIVAGNPAKIIRKLDPSKTIKTRGHWLPDFFQSLDYLNHVEKEMFRENTLGHFLRVLLAPKRGD